MTEEENNKRWDAVIQLSLTELKEKNRNLADEIVEKGRNLPREELRNLLENELGSLREKGQLMSLEDLSEWINKLVNAKSGVEWMETLADFAVLTRNKSI